MTDRYTKLRAALGRVPLAKWTASCATVRIPETGESAAKDLCISGMSKQANRDMARYMASANPNVVDGLLRERDELLEALEEITEQERHLREGGPYPDDASDLSDALETCVGTAVAALKKAAGGKE